MRPALVEVTFRLPLVVTPSWALEPSQAWLGISVSAFTELNVVRNLARATLDGGRDDVRYIWKCHLKAPTSC